MDHEKAEDLFHQNLKQLVASLGGESVVLNIWLADERIGESLAGRTFVGAAANEAAAERARRLQRYFENPGAEPPPRLLAVQVDRPLLSAMVAFDEAMEGRTGMVIVLHHENSAQISMALPETLPGPLERLARLLMSRIPVATPMPSSAQAKRARRRRRLH